MGSTHILLWCNASIRYKKLNMDGEKVAIVGRVMRMRGHGKILFWDILDESGKVQVVIKADTCAPESLKLVPFLT